MSPADDTATRLEHVSVRYTPPTGTVCALDDVSHTFAAGTSTAIRGRSGSGKSTLVSVLSMLRKPTEGRLFVSGVDTAELGEARLAEMRGRSVGVVFQSFHLDPGADAVGNITLPWVFGKDRSMNRHAARARALALLDQLGIADLSARRPGEMSGGQRQRVAIARALFNEPPVLLADEPTGNLDEVTALDVARDLFALPALVGTTVIVVTHDDLVAREADTVLSIAQGRIVDVAVSA